MDIFNYIETVSGKIARKIGKDDSEDDIELYEYSIFMILSNSFTILVGFLLSLSLGYYHIYIPCLLTYSSLRMVAGGQHCDTFEKCFFVSNLVIILCCVIAYIFRNYYILVFFLSAIFSFRMSSICPKPSTNSPSRGSSEDRKFKRKFLFRTCLLLLLQLIFINFGLYLLSVSIGSGILVLCFVLTDFGEHIVSKVSEVI